MQKISKLNQELEYFELLLKSFFFEYKRFSLLPLSFMPQLWEHVEQFKKNDL